MITIYSSTNCKACKQAKTWFEKKGIEYTEKMIDKDDEAMAELRMIGVQSVPVVKIFLNAKVGPQYVVGYAPKQFEKALRGEIL